MYLCTSSLLCTYQYPEKMNKGTCTPCLLFTSERSYKDINSVTFSFHRSYALAYYEWWMYNTCLVCYLQCSSSVGSERNTPVHHQYTQQMSHPTAATTVAPQPHYSFDPRIQSCPTTPLPSFQQQRFDFSQHIVNRVPQNCVSLPNSARNTPVQPGELALFLSHSDELCSNTASLWDFCYFVFYIDLCYILR